MIGWCIHDESVSLLKLSRSLRHKKDKSVKGVVRCFDGMQLIVQIIVVASCQPRESNNDCWIVGFLIIYTPPHFVLLISARRLHDISTIKTCTDRASPRVLAAEQAFVDRPAR